MSNLQTNSRLKLGFKKWTNIQKASGWLTAPNTAKTISCQAWNSLVEYPSWDYKFDIKESDGNMSIQYILKEGLEAKSSPEVSGYWYIH